MNRNYETVLVTTNENEVSNTAMDPLEKRLIDCANVIALIRSIYCWKGEI